MKTTYLGLELRSPVIVGSSPYTADAEGVGQCARHGAGAVVLKSIFEEQILHEAAALERASAAQGGGAPGMGDAGEYLERYLGDHYKAEYLQLIADASKTGIPVIASINCVGTGAGWTDYAAATADAGAAALELNIFLQPGDRHRSSGELEEAYARVAQAVVRAVRIPVAVKLPLRLTNVLAVADRLLSCGVRGTVLFNRFFEPDIDVETLRFVAGDPFSEPSELRNVLRSAAMCSAEFPQLDVAVSTGVHDGIAAAKALLCGAAAVEICTAIHRRGYGAIAEMNRFLDDWADRHGFASVMEFRGRMRASDAADEVLQRVQYMKYFPHGIR